MNRCPVCSEVFDERTCKLRCPRCGYFEDCSDAMLPQYSVPVTVRYLPPSRQRAWTNIQQSREGMP